MAYKPTTEDRLTHDPDSSQRKREGMCLALLPLLGSYTECRARQPGGGSDQGRDIEAIYENRIEVWGAVAFRDQAAKTDRAAMAAKFRDDLKAALRHKPALKGFVFFTNVSLTGAAKDKLKNHAASSGVTWCDIFDFDVLRSVLDSPRGYVVRLRYLRIPMNRAEQLRLISEFGDKIQGAMNRRFDRIDELLRRVEFMSDCLAPVSCIEFVAMFDPRAEPPPAGTAVVVRFDRGHGDGASQDAFANVSVAASASDEKRRCQNFFWGWGTPSQLTLLGDFDWTESPRTLGGSFLMQVSAGRGVMTMSDLATRQVVVYCSRDLNSLA
jgi:hypothetical protein